MIVYTMTTAEMVVEARKDFRALYNRCEKPLRDARREMIRQKQQIIHLMDWTSPRKNHWLLLVHQRKSGPRIYALVWYYDREGRINAMHLAHKGMAFRIDRHVIERYGERFDPTAKPLERLQRFWLENHVYGLEPTKQLPDGRWSVNVGMNHGMGLGLWEQGTEIVLVDTFINHGQMFSNQLDTMDRMDLQRMMTDMTVGQRRFFIDLIKRRHPESIGSPGLTWLEQLAA
ncbi:MAG: hypothetical protein R2811_16740 [Flavobacteriales bacterium]